MALMDATAEKYGLVFRVPKTGTILKVGFCTGTVTVGDTLKAGLYTVDASGNPTATAYGGMVAQTQVVLLTEDDTAFTVTLSTGATATAGDEVALVVEFNSFVAGNLNIAGIVGSSSTANQYPYTLSYTASWAKTSYIPIGWFEYSDGSYAYLPGVYPVTAITSTAINTGSAADELALYFTVPFPTRLSGWGGEVGPQAGANFDVVLYDGTTSLGSQSYDGDSKVSTVARGWTQQLATPIALAAGTVYRLAIKPTTANNVSVPVLTLSSAAAANQLEGGTSLYYSTRVDAGAWTDDTTKRPCLWLLLDQFSDGAGGAGGLLTHPGMSGGMRG